MPEESAALKQWREEVNQILLRSNNGEVLLPGLGKRKADSHRTSAVSPFRRASKKMKTAHFAENGDVAAPVNVSLIVAVLFDCCRLSVVCWFVF